MMALPRRSATPAVGRPRSSFGIASPIRLRNIVGRAAVILLAVGAGPTLAAQASPDAYAVRSLGDWTLAPSSDAPGCFMTRDYAGAGGTTLLFGLDADGQNHLSVLNDNWSIKPKERLTLDFRLSNGRYLKQTAIGMTSDRKRGFVTRLPTKFTADLATSKFLNIDRGDIPVARLTLDGSAPAITELKRCIAAVSAPPSAATAGGNDDQTVPKDPFSRGSNKRSHKPR